MTDGGELGKRIYKYIRLATLICETAAKRCYFALVDRGCVGGEGWSGRRGMIRNFGAWICFDARLWSKFNRSPIWIEFDDGKGSDGRLRLLLPTLQDCFECLIDHDDVSPMIVIPIIFSETDNE